MVHRYFTNDMPLPVRIHGLTKNPVSIQKMVNGYSFSENSYREVVAHYFEYSPAYVCHACKHEIEAGEIGARDWYRESDTYCIGCVSFSAPVRAIKYTYRLKRKSQKNPSGIVTDIDVFTDETFSRYKADMESAGYPIQEKNRQ